MTFLSLLQIKYAIDHEGRVVGEGCCGGKQRIVAKRTVTYGNRLDSVGAVSVTTAHLQLRVAEVNLRYACKRLQIGSQLYYGWQGVVTQRHLNEGAAG